MSLNYKQEKYLLALLTSSSVAEASKKAGIVERTAYKYMSEPAFKAQHRKAMRGLLSTVTGRLQYEATKSVDVLADIRDDEEAPPYTRVEASKILLEMAYKSFELEDVQERLERVEEFINETKN